jgi:hypothetical protein
MTMKNLFSVALLLLSGSLVQAQDINSGLVFYLPCDNNVYIDAAGEVEGVVNGVGITTDDGINYEPNSSFYFDGTTAIDFMDDFIQNLPIGGSQRTYALWFRTGIIEGAWDFLSYGITNPGEHVHLAYRVGEGRIRSGHWFADYDFAITTSLADEQWHHLVVVYTETQVTGYIDGLIAGSFELSTSVPLNTTSNGILRVGARNHTDGLGDPYKGLLDEVRIYNRALSEADVVALNEFRPATTNVSKVSINNFKVFPTLVESELRINTNSNISSLEIVDVSGKVVLKSTMKNNLDVSGLPNGVYFVKGFSAQKNYSAKFIKK